MLETGANHPKKQGIRNLLIWMTLLPVLLSMWMIFGFSSQPAEQSEQTSHRVVDVVIRLFVPDFNTLDAATQTDVENRITVIVRKTAHVLEYAILGFFLQLHAITWQQKRRLGAAESDLTSARRFRIPVWVWSWLAGMVYAITDEVHQSFVENRGPRASDVCFDVAGVVAGVAVCGLLWLIIRRFRHRNQAPF